MNGERLLVIPGWEGGVDPEDGSALVHAIIQSQLRLVAAERARIRAAVEKMTYAEGAPGDGSAERYFEAEGFDWCKQRVLAAIDVEP